MTGRNVLRIKDHTNEQHKYFKVIGDTGKRDKNRGQIVLIKYTSGPLKNSFDEVPYHSIARGSFTGISKSHLDIAMRKKQGKQLAKKYKHLLHTAEVDKKRNSPESIQSRINQLEKNQREKSGFWKPSLKARHRKDSKTGVPGVSWNNKQQKWCASMTVNGKRILYKYFDPSDYSKAVALRKKVEGKISNGEIVTLEKKKAKSGHKFVVRITKGWRFQKVIDGNKAQKNFKTLSAALAYRNQWLTEHNLPIPD